MSALMSAGRASGASQLSARAQVAPGLSRRARIVVHAAKGSKVNSRGKVSSRPGPPSRKEQQRRTQEQEQQQQQQPAGSADPSTSQAAGDEVSTSSAVAASTPAAATASTTPTPTASSSSTSSAGDSGSGFARAVRGQETPQVVVDRMFRRMIACAGTPVVLGMFMFPLFWYLKVVQKVEYPFWIVYLASGLAFGGGLLGITYGVLSTSWDPRREGTWFGWTEFQANLSVLLDRNKQQ